MAGRGSLACRQVLIKEQDSAFRRRTKALAKSRDIVTSIADYAAAASCPQIVPSAALPAVECVGNPSRALYRKEIRLGQITSSNRRRYRCSPALSNLRV